MKMNQIDKKFNNELIEKSIKILKNSKNRICENHIKDKFFETYKSPIYLFIINSIDNELKEKLISDLIDENTAPYMNDQEGLEELFDAFSNNEFENLKNISKKNIEKTIDEYGIEELIDNIIDSLYQMDDKLKEFKKYNIKEDELIKQKISYISGSNCLVEDIHEEDYYYMPLEVSVYENKDDFNPTYSYTVFLGCVASSPFDAKMKYEKRMRESLRYIIKKTGYDIQPRNTLWRNKNVLFRGWDSFVSNVYIKHGNYFSKGVWFCERDSKIPKYCKYKVCRLEKSLAEKLLSEDLNG